MSFKQYFFEALKPMKLQGSTGLNRKRQNLVAQYDKKDPTYPQALERLKKVDSGRSILNPVNAKKVIELYKIKDIAEGHPRTLGNTGITLSIENGKYYISK